MTHDNRLETKQRDYLFDNCKVLLILLVVIGHFIEPCMKNNAFLHTLKWIIVSFHMPAFIFISGYFSKKELSFFKIVQKLLIPYLVYEIVYYLFYTFIMHKETKLYLLYPKFSLWYLLALFIWRVLTPYVKKIPHYMFFSVAAGLMIGLYDMPDNFLSIPRVIYFFPFFLTGVHFTRDNINKIRTPYFRILSLCSILILTICYAKAPIFQDLSVKIFYGRYNYDFLNQLPLTGLIERLICYAIGFVMTTSLLALTSENKHFFSSIGTRTMAIYLFHGLTYSYLKECTTLLKHVNTAEETILLLFFCLLLVIIFSIPQFTVFTTKIANLSLASGILQHLSLRYRIQNKCLALPR